MATLLTENFANNPDGPPGNADSGQPWVLTGADALTVISGMLTLGGSDTNGYATTDLGGTPDGITATYLFHAGSPDATVCIINHDEAEFVGANMRAHIVITPHNLVFQLRQNNGAFETIGDPISFAGLPVNTPLGLVLSIAGDTISMIAPDGTGHAFVDSRFVTMGGRFLAVQTIRTGGGDPLGAWLTVNATGTPAPVPDVVPTVQVNARMKDALTNLPKGAGTATFTCPVELINSAGYFIGPKQIGPVSIVDGEFTETVKLMATDTAGASPESWQWQVEIETDEWTTLFRAPLPYNAGTPTTLGQMWNASPQNTD